MDAGCACFRIPAIRFSLNGQNSKASWTDTLSNEGGFESAADRTPRTSSQKVLRHF